MENVKYPLSVILFSGKRKSGKDYFTEKLLEMCNTEKIAVLKVSLPIKDHFCKLYNLDLKDLLSSSNLKENYRREMIRWGEDMRGRDPGVFCRSAIEMSRAETKPVWIVTDSRRKTDIAWFKEKYGDVVRTVRIEAEEYVRQQRGWIYTKGIDDCASECDLDDYACWDWKVENNGDDEKFNNSLLNISQHVRQFC